MLKTALMFEKILPFSVISNIFEMDISLLKLASFGIAGTVVKISLILKP